MLVLRLPVGLAAGALMVAGCANGSGFSEARTVQFVDAVDRQPAPRIQGRALSGSVIDARSYAGSVVLVNFWGSWCAPSRVEQPKLNAVYAAEHPRGVEFLGIDIRDNDAAARSFLRSFDVRYPSIVDEGNALARQFEPRLPDNPPITVVIDRAGRIAAKILGPASVEILRPLLAQLLTEPVT